MPFGAAAFFEGALVHTNELTCHLGADVYAERSARQAAELLLRRSSEAAGAAAAARDALGALRGRAAALGEVSQDTDGFFEIREEYVEPTPTPQPPHAAAQAAAAPRPRRARAEAHSAPDADDDALMARATRARGRAHRLQRVRCACL